MHFSGNDIKKKINIVNYFFYIIKGKYVIITSAKTTPKKISSYKPITKDDKNIVDRSSGNNGHSGLSSIGNNKIADERIRKDFL